MDFWVRNATNKDTEGLVAVIKEVYEEFNFGWFPEGYHADLYDIEAHYWRKGHAFWVAETLEDQPRIIGTCAIHAFPPIPLGGEGGTTIHEGVVRASGADCSLERLYVSPSARMGGVGSTLFEHALNYARERGFKRMEIWSDKLLVAAHRLYERSGAVVVGERLCHDPDQSPEWGMMLPLRGTVDS